MSPIHGGTAGSCPVSLSFALGLDERLLFIYSSLFGSDNLPQLKPQLFLYVLGYNTQYLYGHSLLSHLNSCHLLLHGESKEKVNY